jgi:hypothetical protein
LGLLEDLINCVAIDGNGNKWIGIGYSGCLAKFDGTNWTKYNSGNSGLPDNTVNCLAIDGNGNKWIGTNLGGLAVFNENGVVSIEDKSKITPNTFLIAQNYPNPFNPSTLISYSLPIASKIKLIVYNAIGQTVKILENEFKNAGNYSVTFNAGELTSGIYFYKIEAGQFSQVKKMMLIK